MCVSRIIDELLYTFLCEKAEGQERDTGPDKFSDRQKEREEWAVTVRDQQCGQHCTRETGPSGERRASWTWTQAGQVVAHACPGKLVKLTPGMGRAQNPVAWFVVARGACKHEGVRLCVSQMTELKGSPSLSCARLECQEAQCPCIPYSVDVGQFWSCAFVLSQRVLERVSVFACSYDARSCSSIFKSLVISQLSSWQELNQTRAFFL